MSYLIVGLVNLIVISYFTYSFYHSRRETILKRSEAVLTSLRDLISAKTGLALDKYKLNAALLSDETPITKKISPDPAVEAVWMIKGRKPTLLYGKKPMPEIPFDEMRENHFYEMNANLFALKIVRENQTFIWLYNSNLMSDVFNHTDGIAKKNKVYFVGKDKKIRTTVKGNKSDEPATSDDESITQAFDNKSGSDIVRNHTGKEVLRSYSLFLYDGLEFAVMVEIPTKEVNTLLNGLMKELLFICATMVGINFFFSMFFAHFMTNTVDKLNKEILDLNQQREKQSNESAIQVIRVQEEEREKISFTLHDSVGQYLTVLRWGLSELRGKFPQEKESITNLVKTCDDIIHEIRSISHDLMPKLIKDFGCIMAIKDYFEKQKQIVPLDMVFNYSLELEGAHFRREFDVNLYRMVQEFFQNTLKHSGATALKLEITKTESHLLLMYYDNGKGMKSDGPLPASLNYRAKLFGGEMARVNYDKGLGFKITFSIEDIKHEAS